MKDILNTQYFVLCNLFCLSSPEWALYETKDKVIIVLGLQYSVPIMEILSYNGQSAISTMRKGHPSV